MSKINSLDIHFAGRTYKLSCEDSIEHMQRVDEFINAKYAQLCQDFGDHLPDKESLLALTAINAADSCVQLAEYCHHLESEIQEQIKKNNVLQNEIMHLEDEIMSLEIRLYPEQQGEKHENESSELHAD